MRPIGIVKILRDRIYPLDAESSDDLRSQVIVEPGLYQVYRDGMATFWLMRGKLNRRGTWREGDGVFALYQYDSASDVEVVFPSRRFGPDEWAELLAGPEVIEGPQQRLQFSLAEDGAP